MWIFDYDLQREVYPIMKILQPCQISFYSKLFGSGKAEIHSDHIKITNHANETITIEKSHITRYDLQTDLEKLNNNARDVLSGAFMFGVLGAALTATRINEDVSKYIRFETKIKDLEELYITFFGDTCVEYEKLKSWMQ
jgi:hypothetical protein